MVLTAEQQWMVAMAYEKAAADRMGIPAPQRAAFTRKAKRFRTLARIAAKIEATAVIRPGPHRKPLQTPIVHQPWAANLEWRPKAKFPSLAELLEEARGANGLPRAGQTPANQKARLAGGA
jgi:hypothetical protein